MERLRNNAESTLDGAINNSQTTLDVLSATPFPTSGNFRIIIESEIMLVTGVSGTTFTVERGKESTTAASHADGLKVVLVLTEEGLETYMGEYVLEGDTASLPAAEKPGRLYLPNDSQVIFRDSGSAWDAYGPLWKLWTPTDTGYSWGNQQSATYTARNDGILIEGGTAGSSQWTIRGRRKNRAGTSTGYKLTVGMVSMLNSANFSMAGIGLYESATDKVEIIRCHSDSGVPRASCTRSTALQAGTTTALGTSLELSYLGTFPIIHWMQIEQTSTNFVYKYSNNQVDWVTLSSHSKTAGFTTAPDQFIIHVVPFSLTCKALFVSVREET